MDGLFLFIAVNGTKSWHFRYMFAGKAARISFGTYSEISLRQARDYRDEARAKIATGIDPRKQRAVNQGPSSEETASEGILFHQFADY